MAGNEKRRISAVDIGIIVVIIACIVFGFFKMGALDKIRSLISKENATLYFVCENVPDEKSGVLDKGKTLYRNGKYFGTVDDAVSSEPTLVYKEADDGRYVSSQSETGVDIKTSVEVSVTKTDRGTLLDGEYIAPGQKVTVTCDGVDFEIIVLNIVLSGE